MPTIPNIRRLCYSHDIFCTGARPCQPCFEHQKAVLASALFRSGIADVVGAVIVDAFALSLTESVYTMLIQQDVTVSADPPAAPPELPAPSVEHDSAKPSSLDVMALMEQAMVDLGPGELREFCQQIMSGTLEGWDLLSEEERGSMRALASKVIQPPKKKKAKGDGAPSKDGGVVAAASSAAPKESEGGAPLDSSPMAGAQGTEPQQVETAPGAVREGN